MKPIGELKNVGQTISCLVKQREEIFTLLYIGESEDPYHCSHKTTQQAPWYWWTGVVVCISKTTEFTKSHVKYLEWYCHGQANAAGRFKIVHDLTVPFSSLMSQNRCIIAILDGSLCSTIRILIGTVRVSSI